ncbi:hypothetical protein CVIRNUC_007408 [Coccomyxa viridis]|uniref:Uncharacterized protein n=1 Tax=Coccomyxa viridis TaxID=1274662 RepID=A0AAV1IDX8_9CHLO|nr:hypothetical protein CVIRNUC_007408 [Coccomyxa viridis]
MALRNKCCWESQDEIALLCHFLFNREDRFEGSGALSDILAKWLERAREDENQKPRTRAWYRRRAAAMGYDGQAEGDEGSSDEGTPEPGT